MRVEVKGGRGDSGRGGKGLQKEVGCPGCASCQFGESACFGVGLGGPLWGSGSLQSGPSEGQVVIPECRGHIPLWSIMV
jgi:hypothetical protein